MRSLYPFQETGASFLSSTDRRYAYLADEMGLGKTVQAIAATRHYQPQRTTVVCPASVVENWKREWDWWGGYGELEVISYSMLIRKPRDSTELVILDEAHYCKTPGSKRTKAALKLAAGAKKAWLLSGTPMPNDPRELYPAVRALWPEWLQHVGIGTAFDWMDYFCVWSESEYGYRIHGTKPMAKAILVPFLHRVMLRRRLKDVALELPPLRTDVQYLPRDPTMAEELEELGADMEGEEHMSRMRRFLGSYKAPRIGEIILRELAERQYDGVVVLYHHHDTRDVLYQMFNRAGHEVAGFDGGTPPAIRQWEIDHFQNSGSLCPIFLAQQGAAGVGLTLTRASEVVLVEPSWSPSDNEQAIKRIHRIGQEHPCRARLFAVPDSLDESLMNTLRRKSQMVEEVVDG